MPCKFVFKTLPDLNTIDVVDRALEYSTIYKIGDDLRQDQLVLQMIALMDKVRFLYLHTDSDFLPKLIFLVF